VSGTDLQVGAVYLFKTVKPTVDAKVTVLSMTGGVYLNSIDETWTGFNEAFQPFIKVDPLANGYIEFQIDFINPANGAPKVQGMVPVTCIDVDGVDYGNGILYEQDQVQLLTGGYYDFNMAGGNLQVLNPPGWVTIKNVSGFSYSGIDTVQRDVMATVVNHSVSSVRVRIGALNTSPDNGEVRYRSVYFKKFSYPNSVILPNRTTLSFTATARQEGTLLKGLLSASHTYDKLIIERGASSRDLKEIAILDISGSASSSTAFDYLDREATDAISYYRLHLVNSAQRVAEYSNTIMVKRDQTEIAGLKIIGSVLDLNNPVLRLQSSASEEIQLRVTDLSGRVITSMKTRVSAGINTISLPANGATRGYFVVGVATATKAVSQKIIIQ
jgi:hypothetical protein